ncbi:MAG TPA: MlaD family protein [Burkholderiales bacterium]|nr:MlaD family protein [Burkholderiales bacterium]
MESKPESAASSPFVPKSLGIKVGMLLAFAIMVAIALVGYVLYARGVFEQTQRLTLVADNVEGVSAGMDLTFAGFPIGRVRRLSLSDDGKGRIHIRVPVSEVRWLRTTTIFTLEVPLVGAAKIRAFTANLQDPPLPDRSERPVLRGDANAEIPLMIATLRSVLENIDRITDNGSSLQESLKNVRTVTERMAGKQGVLGAALGGEDNAKKLLQTIDRANALLASLGGVSLKLDAVLSKTDQRLYGAGGIADETQKAVAQANAILGEVRASLKRVDDILANTQAATTDLASLRAEVEASLRKVAALIDELNRKWPFERDTKIKLP